MCDAPIVSVSGFSPGIHETKHYMAESGTLRRHVSKEDESMVDKELLTAMSDLLDQKLEEKLDQKFDKKLGPVYDRLDKLDENLESVNDRLNQVDKNLGSVNDRLNQVDENLGLVCGRLDKLELDMKYVRVFQLENVIIPRLNTIEQSYLDTSERYMEKTDQIDTMEQNIGVLKSVVQNHSDRLNRLSV